MQFIRIPENLIFENISTNPKILDEIDMLESELDSNMDNEIKIPHDVLNSFKLKEKLNQEFFPNNQLDPKISNKLLKITQDFLKELDVQNLRVKDIIFTGSLANYNWSKFSDVDIHIIVDTKDVDMDPKLLNDLFFNEKVIWNQKHEIKILDYPVELYVQDINQPLIATAVYSINKNKWLKKPKREEFKIDKKTIKNKAMSFINQLKDIRKDYKEDNLKQVIDKAINLKTKIKQMRNSGLERGGEFSLENLVFKTLRRTSFIEQLNSFKDKAYDKLMSII